MFENCVDVTLDPAANYVEINVFSFEIKFGSFPIFDEFTHLLKLKQIVLTIDIPIDENIAFIHQGRKSRMVFS